MHKNASNHSSFAKWMLMKGPSAEMHKFPYFDQMLLYSIILSVLSSFNGTDSSFSLKLWPYAV